MMHQFQIVVLGHTGAEGEVADQARELATEATVPRQSSSTSKRNLSTDLIILISLSHFTNY